MLAKHPQKHQQTRMSSPIIRNFNKTQGLKMQSNPLQPAILLIDEKKKAPRLRGAFVLTASKSFLSNILTVTPMDGIF
jgi:hypothetical protein